MPARAWKLLFVAYAAATALHVGWVMAHEPFSFDAWNVAKDTNAEPITLGRFFDYWAGQYAHSNPRLGQPLTYLAYKLAWFAPIATPLAFLAIAFGATTLGLGRWPRTLRDHALVSVAIGSLWFALPSIGMIMFCRAFGANYVYGAAVQLWFVVVLRLVRREVGWPATIAYGVFGVAAGMSNEHTGPALCAFLLGHLIWRFRRGDARRIDVAGMVGAVVGFAAIFFAPGQGERYDSAVQRVGLASRLLQRGLVVNFDIFRELVFAAAPVLAVVLIAFVLDDARAGDRESTDARRRALRFAALAAVAGTAVCVTLFVSPKLGPRFYIAPMIVVVAAMIGILDVTVRAPARLAPFVVLAVVASGYAALRTVGLYGRVSRESDDRLAALAATEPGAVFTADAWSQVPDSWWFHGDDFRDASKRHMVADYFDLGGVIFRAADLDAPLGVTDVRLVPRYEISPASCLDELGGLQLGEFQGVNVGAIQAAMRAGIDDLQRRLPAGATLSELELDVAFAGAQPRLPAGAKRILVARWTPARFDGWFGDIVRQTAGQARTVVMPTPLVGQPYEIWVYQPGGDAKDLGPAQDGLQYVPWHSGAYWVMACRGDDCFVIAATRQS
nr:DUF6056 family protein [Kofleriaceae bacterium]